MIIDKMLKLMPTVVAYIGSDIETDDDGNITHENEKYRDVLADERHLTKEEEGYLFDVDEADASIIEICSLPIAERKIVIVKRLEKLINRYALLVCLNDTYFDSGSQQESDVNDSIKKARFAQRSSLEMYISKLVEIGIEFDCIDEKLIRDSFIMSTIESEFIEQICSITKPQQHTDSSTKQNEVRVENATDQSNSMEVFKSYFKSPFILKKDDDGNSLMDRLKQDMKRERKDVDYASIALLILNSNVLKENKRKKERTGDGKPSFAKWYTIFCDAFNLNRSTYKPNGLSPRGFEIEFYYIINYR
ncbi:MAG: hypothetical protein ABFC90_07305 [Bacteroidales bacterium]|nr:hypothetical protein [Bacteroidales bacterium]